LKFPRRQFLHLAAGAAALPALSRIASAQAYPTRPVRLIITFAAGGSNDIVARLMGQWLSERLGQQFVVENRPGAGGNIGTEAATKATPDGYTLLIVSTANAISGSLYDHLSFDVVRDLVPVAGIMRGINVVAINPLVPANTIPEFINYAKANPGKVTMASSGIGSSAHLSGELFKMMTGVSMIHVPYRGEAPALTDLIGGQVQMMFDPIPSSIEYIKAGTLRALAVTSATRLGAMPDVPAVSEFVPGYEATGFIGISAPRNTSNEIVEKLNKAINAVLESPTAKARFADMGSVVLPGSPADFRKFFVQETEKWAKVVRFAGIKAD
jgi:tripartite-type tricarboxylate transporter receptor subunit TctC